MSTKRASSLLLLLALLAGCASAPERPIVVERDAQCPYVPPTLTSATSAPQPPPTYGELKVYALTLLERLGLANADKRAIRAILERGDHPAE